MADPITADFLALQTALAGRYSLGRELGRGGMGIVYLAHEVALDRPVALKLLPPELSVHEEVRQRFLQEARIAAKLSHPNIVPIFAVDEVGGFVFFVMALIDGETLGERVRARGPLSNSSATRLVRELAWALAYAHGQGVIHRDVKPDNIMLEHGTGRALVMDFGIAQTERPASTENEGTGHVLGTAEFMSPERATGAPVDRRSDLYSLGAVGFYAVTGRAPFEGDSPTVVLAKHVTEPAPPVASVALEVPTPLARAIDRCLRKEPEHRFEDGGAIADALTQESAEDRQSPIALRVFIRRLREIDTPLGVLLGIVFYIILDSTGIVGGLAALVVGGGAIGGYILWAIRELLRAGYTAEDARLAWAQDVIHRNDEFGAIGKGEARLGSAAVIGGLATGGLLLAGASLGLGALFPLGGFIFIISAAAFVIRRRSPRPTADDPGESWLKFLSGRGGDRLFKLAGLGLETRAAIGAGTYRPTEVVISTSAARLFEQLPEEARKTLAGLPATLTELESKSRTLRAQVGELDDVLAEIGDDPSAAGYEAHATVRAELIATRDEAAARLRETVAALEAIRVGLLRMHAGERVLQNVTIELEAAKELSSDISDLLEGHREVERLLAARRTSGAFGIVDE